MRRQYDPDELIRRIKRTKALRLHRTATDQQIWEAFCLLAQREVICPDDYLTYDDEYEEDGRHSLSANYRRRLAEVLTERHH
jgi:hypothetical protein